MLPEPGYSFVSDYSCTICGEGGDILCCEKCPKTFHTICLAMPGVPEGDFICPFCLWRAKHPVKEQAEMKHAEMKYPENAPPRFKPKPVLTKIKHATRDADVIVIDSDEENDRMSDDDEQPLPSSSIKKSSSISLSQLPLSAALNVSSITAAAALASAPHSCNSCGISDTSTMRCMRCSAYYHQKLGCDPAFFAVDKLKLCHPCTKQIFQEANNDMEESQDEEEEEEQEEKSHQAKSTPEQAQEKSPEKIEPVIHPRRYFHETPLFPPLPMPQQSAHQLPNLPGEPKFRRDNVASLTLFFQLLHQHFVHSKSKPKSNSTLSNAQANQLLSTASATMAVSSGLPSFSLPSSSPSTSLSSPAAAASSSSPAASTSSAAPSAASPTPNPSAFLAIAKQFPFSIFASASFSSSSIDSCNCDCKDLFGPITIFTPKFSDTDAKTCMDSFSHFTLLHKSLVYELQTKVELLDAQWQMDLQNYTKQLYQAQAFLVSLQSHLSLSGLTLLELEAYVDKQLEGQEPPADEPISVGGSETKLHVATSRVSWRGGDATTPGQLVYRTLSYYWRELLRESMRARLPCPEIRLLQRKTTVTREQLDTIRAEWDTLPFISFIFGITVPQLESMLSNGTFPPPRPVKKAIPFISQPPSASTSSMETTVLDPLAPSPVAASSLDSLWQLRYFIDDVHHLNASFKLLEDKFHLDFEEPFESFADLDRYYQILDDVYRFLDSNLKSGHLLSSQLMRDYFCAWHRDVTELSNKYQDTDAEAKIKDTQKSVKGFKEARESFVANFKGDPVPFVVASGMTSTPEAVLSMKYSYLCFRCNRAFTSEESMQEHVNDHVQVLQQRLDQVQPFSFVAEKQKERVEKKAKISKSTLSPIPPAASSSSSSSAVSAPAAVAAPSAVNKSSTICSAEIEEILSNHANEMNASTLESARILLSDPKSLREFSVIAMELVAKRKREKDSPNESYSTKKTRHSGGEPKQKKAKFSNNTASSQPASSLGTFPPPDSTNAFFSLPQSVYSQPTAAAVGAPTSLNYFQPILTASPLPPGTVAVVATVPATAEPAIVAPPAAPSVEISQQLLQQGDDAASAVASVLPQCDTSS